MIDYDDASEGISKWDTGEALGEMILETFDNDSSVRIYRFADCKERGGEHEFYYRIAFLETVLLRCPDCNCEIYSDEEQCELHDDMCKHRFTDFEIREFYRLASSSREKWTWGEVHNTLESIYLDLFRDKLIHSKIITTPQFKALYKLIERREDQICKKFNPHHISGEEYDRVAKKYKAEEKRELRKGMH